MRDEYSGAGRSGRQALHDRYIGGIRAPDAERFFDVLMNAVVKKWPPSATPELIALGSSLALLIAAVLLPLWLVPVPAQRLDVWLYAGAALAPLTAAALIGFVVIGRRRIELALDPEGFYRALEINPRSAQSMADAEIQALVVRQYRALARRCHPDVAKDGERMRLINRAYQELKDSGRRQRYSGTNGA